MRPGLCQHFFNVTASPASCIFQSREHGFGEHPRHTPIKLRDGRVTVIMVHLVTGRVDPRIPRMTGRAMLVQPFCLPGRDPLLKEAPQRPALVTR